MGVEQRLEDLVCAQVNIKERYMVPLLQLINLRYEGKADKEEVGRIYKEMLKFGPEIDLLVKKELFQLGLDPRIEELIHLVRSKQICIIPGYDGEGGKLVNTKRMLWDWMEQADMLFQTEGDHSLAWSKAERIKELMESGAMTVTQEEHEGLLRRGVPKPV